MTALVILLANKEKSVLRKHPWIYASAIKKTKGKLALGDLVEIHTHNGQWLARGSYSPSSQIRVRIWTFDHNQAIDQAFFEARINQALAVRQPIISRQSLTGYRLIAAENDGLPGVTIDVYENTLVAQFLSAGAERFKALIVSALQQKFPRHRIYERSDVEVRTKEGLLPVTSTLKGEFEHFEQTIDENQFKILVDIQQGHKTGFYLDQRDARAALEKYTKDGDVLNCFCYTGAFSLYALRGQAKSVTNVDVSAAALAMAKRNIELNQLNNHQVTYIKQDVFSLLRLYRDQAKRFKVIILDPPKFVDSKANLNNACRGYKDINRLAMQLLESGGYLFTFSCSGLLDTQLFNKVVADAALDAKKSVYYLERLTQAQDHPVASFYPEGLYLKGLVCQIFDTTPPT